jgi:hypothetical protein
MDEMSSSKNNPEEDTIMNEKSSSTTITAAQLEEFRKLQEADRQRKEKQREQGKKWRVKQQLLIAKAKAAGLDKD